MAATPIDILEIKEDEKVDLDKLLSAKYSKGNVHEPIVQEIDVHNIGAILSKKEGPQYAFLRSFFEERDIRIQDPSLELKKERSLVPARDRSPFFGAELISGTQAIFCAKKEGIYYQFCVEFTHGAMVKIASNKEEHTWFYIIGEKPNFTGGSKKVYLSTGLISVDQDGNGIYKDVPNKYAMALSLPRRQFLHEANRNFNRPDGRHDLGKHTKPMFHIEAGELIAGFVTLCYGNDLIDAVQNKDEPYRIQLAFRLMQTIGKLIAGGKIHGDLKLQNICYSEENGIVLIDIDRMFDIFSKQQNNSIGTLYYLFTSFFEQELNNLCLKKFTDKPDTERNNYIYIDRNTRQYKLIKMDGTSCSGIFPPKIDLNQDDLDLKETILTYLLNSGIHRIDLLLDPRYRLIQEAWSLMLTASLVAFGNPEYDDNLDEIENQLISLYNKAHQLTLPVVHHKIIEIIASYTSTFDLSNEPNENRENNLHEVNSPAKKRRKIEETSEIGSIHSNSSTFFPQEQTSPSTPQPANGVSLVSHSF